MTVPTAVGSGRALEPSTKALEFVAFNFPLDGALVVGWPAAPGAVRYDGDGRPVLLHYAPARWLAPTPSAGIVALLEAAAQSAAGAVIDVEGKWTALKLAGPEAARLLAATVDIEAVLEGRDCAALTLFDCPAVVARAADGFGIWVHASYASDLVEALNRQRSAT